VAQNRQIVNINQKSAPCQQCGSNLIEITNFSYAGETTSTSAAREELCKCKNCGSTFILHYDLFDSEGHIYSKVFTEDVNNPSYNWQDSLTEDQKKAIAGHLQHCSVCVDRLSHELLTDAWLKSFITNLRKTGMLL
jgi:hypothetical protein